MTEDEREELAALVESEVGPLLDKRPFDDGYDCCGCSSYRDILDHAVAIIRGEKP